MSPSQAGVDTATSRSRVDPELLEAREWDGESAFRCLSHYFSVRYSGPRFGSALARALGSFEVSPGPREHRSSAPGSPTIYSLIDLGADAKARYQLLQGTTVLIEGSSQSAAFNHLLWHINSETFRLTGDYLLIHAGAVVTPSGQGVLLPAASGSGKSTLTTALVRAGFGYLSDEAGAICPIGRRLYPFPRALTLKGEKIERFFPELADAYDPDFDGHQTHIPVDDIRPGAIAGPTEVGFVIAPRYRPKAGLELTETSPAEAAMVLGSNSMNLHLYGGRALPLLADIAAGARSYRLEFGDLTEAVATIERVTNGPSSNGAAT